MAEFSVWAPKAQSVELDINNERIEMTSTEHGWWCADVPWAGPGTDYAFRLDGGEPLPDPRSPWQPHGVHGPSRLVDHDAFEWTDHGWRAQPLSSAVIYEAHIGTFSPEGTFDGAIPFLDHLVDLGVTHFELMPVAQFSGERGWGYDGVDLFAPQHSYGGPDGLKRLVDACHNRGLAVLLDVVYNHLGPEGSYVDRFGPYFTTRYCLAWGAAYNFDHTSSVEVRRFISDNALMWLRDYHLDGLRIDAIHYMVDVSARHIVEEIAQEAQGWEAHLGRPIAIIAESTENDSRLIRPREAGGFGLAALWSEDFEHAMHATVTGEMSGYYDGYHGIPDVATVLKTGFVYMGQIYPYLDRHFGRPFEGGSGHHIIAYNQTHDHVGNRALGERLGHLTTPGKLRIASALLFTSPFVPMLFQGEEWNASTPFQYFTDHGDPDLATAVREGRRREFAAFMADVEDVPDPQARETFARSKLNWSELHEPERAALLDWHKRLIRLRRAMPDLTNGRLDRVQVSYDADLQWIMVHRGSVLVACNLSDRAQSLPFNKFGSLEILLYSDEEALVEIAGARPPESVVIGRIPSSHPSVRFGGTAIELGAKHYE